MVYLFLPSCMIVMYNVFVILYFGKKGGSRGIQLHNFFVCTYYNIFVCAFFSL